MRCGKTDCRHYYQGHLACQDCWRGKGLRDGYEPTTPYSEQGRLCNSLGRVWEEYCLGRLTKRHAVRVLAYVQRTQALIMDENVETCEPANYRLSYHSGAVTDDGSEDQKVSSYYLRLSDERS